MSEFVYRAKDMQGVLHTGDVESPDAHAAVAIVRKRGFIIISLEKKNAEVNPLIARFLNRVSFSDLVVVTRQLATMISSGLVLSEAIDILEEQQPNKYFRKVLFEISQDVKGGLTLAQVLGKYPNIFPHLYVNLVKSGEASGKLDSVLIQMADGLEKDREFKAKIRGAMIYPAVVLSMMVIVIIIMMVFVIPKLVGFYSQSSIDLPLPTKILIATSNLFVNFWWIGLILFFGTVFAIRKWDKTPEGHYFIGKTILKLPIAGRIVTNIALTNFSRTFGLLTAAGIPLLDSIGIVTDVIDNPVYKEALKDAYKGVEKGLLFSTLLVGTVFPRIVSQMVKVGEETGKLDEIFIKLAEYFESESDHLIKNLTVAIEPIVIIILGVGVGFLVISIILPIYKLTTSF